MKAGTVSSFKVFFNILSIQWTKCVSRLISAKILLLFEMTFGKWETQIYVPTQRESKKGFPWDADGMAIVMEFNLNWNERWIKLLFLFRFTVWCRKFSHAGNVIEMKVERGWMKHVHLCYKKKYDKFDLTTEEYGLKSKTWDSKVKVPESKTRRSKFKVRRSRFEIHSPKPAHSEFEFQRSSLTY